MIQSLNISFLGRIKKLFFELTIAPIIQHKQHYSVIDKHIKPAVDAINNIDGVVTIASCHGHLTGHIESPYIYFKAPVEIATFLHNHIWHANLHPHKNNKTAHSPCAVSL